MAFAPEQVRFQAVEKWDTDFRDHDVARPQQPVNHATIFGIAAIGDS